MGIRRPRTRLLTQFCCHARNRVRSPFVDPRGLRLAANPIWGGAKFWNYKKFWNIAI